MDFTIVIPCFNSPERVDCLLESIFKFYPKADPKKIIVSDDCSPRKEEVRIVANKHGVLFTHPPKWMCVGGNTNHAVGLAEDNLVFVINDDLLISKGSLETMQKFWEDNQHLRIGAVGFLFIQSTQLVEIDIISNMAKFYPPVWNNGEIKYNSCKFKKPFLPQPFMKPLLTPTPSGPCFAVNKTAWEDSGKFHEFGMWEGGAFHAMWEKGWVLFMIPTPSLLHAIGRGTGDKSEFLKQMYAKYPEKRPYMHEQGEEIYKTVRNGRGYKEDTAYMWDNLINPRTSEILKSVKYDFDAEAF